MNAFVWPIEVRRQYRHMHVPGNWQWTGNGVHAYVKGKGEPVPVGTRLVADNAAKGHVVLYMGRGVCAIAKGDDSYAFVGLHTLQNVKTLARAEREARRRRFKETNATLFSFAAERGLDGDDLAAPARGWKCSESPLGVCIYDTGVDPQCDECLVCAEPSERK